MEKYKFLEHTADIKFQVFGKNLNEIFENITLAISEIIGREQKVKSNKIKNIEVEGHDKKSLIYNFIEELLYLVEAEDFLVSKSKASLSGNKLKAELYGDSASKYKDLDHIKSPTYHDMYIKKVSNKKKNWEAQIVVDV